MTFTIPDYQIDPLLRVEVLTAMDQPQFAAYCGMHQDYSEFAVYDEVLGEGSFPSERSCGEKIVKHLLKGERGHYGPLEHSGNIVFNVINYPHSVMQQARTHRVGVSFDVQSGRYTGKRFLLVTSDDVPTEEVFYFRPEGEYTDRQGKRYVYTAENRENDILATETACYTYFHKINQLGFAEEHARDSIPFNFRQHFVVSFNARSLMHFLDLRAKLDAQLEIRIMAQQMLPHFQQWMPEVAEWYLQTRLGKARLAP
jgi:thymidylate synthase (FAD)